MELDVSHMESIDITHAVAAGSSWPRWCDVLVNSSRSAYAQGTSTDVASAAGITNQARAAQTPSLSLLHAQLMLNVGRQDKLSVEPKPLGLLSSSLRVAGLRSDLHSHSRIAFVI